MEAALKTLNTGTSIGGDQLRGQLIPREREMTHRVWRIALTLAFVSALLIRPALAQEPTNAELKKDIQTLSEAVKALQQNLQEIKALLQQRGGPPAPPQNVTLDLGNRPFKGRINAPLTLVEFSDFQCPFCARHVRETESQIVKEYIETGKLKLVFMDFPLESIHKQAFKAAETARCAGEQGRFWDMHYRLFDTQPDPNAFSDWTAHASALNLKMPEFESCLSGSKYAAEIRKDLMQGQAAGVTGTPGFFLAATDPTSAKVKTLQLISGAQPFANFKTQIDALLKERESEDAKPR